ncbi:hypothetical protein MLD38_020951 [Melastoma candidum]|uniref:Uncharacterized protein n=1 Tax=Melastoma candidum TaxID=119954 RepID=A0ACB9QEV5_9MYRT|nr:hypothetical protein MLD38_020951 [Melastoma candidum]
MPEKGNMSYTDEEKRRKMKKWAAYIAAFVIFQTGVILVFALVVMKVRTPKFRVGDGLQISNLNTSTSSGNSIFTLQAVAPIRIKNRNFGPYKYDATTVNFTYAGANVGQATVQKGKAGFMGTKKLDVDVTLSSAKVTGQTIGAELTVRSVGTLNGKVEMMWIFKKKKAIHMDCTIVLDVSGKTVKSVACV